MRYAVSLFISANDMGDTSPWIESSTEHIYEADSITVEDGEIFTLWLGDVRVFGAPLNHVLFYRKVS